MPRDQSGAGLAGVSTAPVVAEAEEGGRNAEQARRRDERASDSVMLFMRGGGWRAVLKRPPCRGVKFRCRRLFMGGLD